MLNFHFVAESIVEVDKGKRGKQSACRETGGGSDGVEAECNVSTFLVFVIYLEA